MVQASTAAHFWAAIEDCLVTFHGEQRCAAAEKVSAVWRRLPVMAGQASSTYSDMIYHAEPWQIACNLAQNDLPVSQYQAEYQALLARNGLGTTAAT
jgi:hypothetical protein